MPKTKISEFDVDPANNTDINSINIAEGCAPSGINNAIRQLMSDLKEWQSGSQDVYITPAGTVSAPAITTTGDTNTGIFFPAADTIAFTEGGTEAMRIDSSGNVGIGTSSPAQEVELKKDQASSTLLKVTNKTASSAATAGFQIENSTSDLATVELWDSGTVGAATAYGLNLINAGSGGVNLLANNAGGTIKFATGGTTERMRIDSSGNVGIGTTAGITTVSSGIAINNATAGNYPGLEIQTAGVTRMYLNANNSESYISSVGTNPLVSYTNGSERMRIDSSGNLLVGTTSGTDYRIRAERSDNFGLARFQNNLSSGVTYDQVQIIVGQSASSGYMFARYYASAGASPQFAFRGDGQMLATSTSIASISDARTKENIKDAEDGLETIVGLRTVRFDFKEGFGNNKKNQLGFIAQEIEQVFPEAVDVSGQFDENGDEYKTVAPSTLIPVLVKAIQEQQAIINDLKARIETLESK